MSNTHRLGLPELDGQQALKHITHNEALWKLDSIVHLAVTSLDQNSPPAAPELGDCYEIGSSPMGGWIDQAGKIAMWTPGGWRFAMPQTGWLLWHLNEQRCYVFVSDQWELLSAWLGEVQNAGMVGVNAAADLTNKLLVRSNAALFTAVDVGDGGSGDLRINLNKSDTAKANSLVFQSNYSARAEIGTIGNDDFVFKVSADGSTFHESLALDSAEGFVTFGEIIACRITYPQISGGVLNIGSSYVIPSPEAGVSDQIDTLSGGKDGAIVVFSGTYAKQITFKDGTGNLKLGGDRLLDNFEDTLMLVRRGSDWLELSYAQNG